MYEWMNEYMNQLMYINRSVREGLSNDHELEKTLSHGFVWWSLN